MKLFSRRIGRTEYWTYTAVLIAVAVLLEVFGLSRSGNVLLLAWLLIWTWRLHDFGRSGWYNLIPIGAMLTVTAAAIVLLFNDKEFSDAFAVVIGTDDRAFSDRGIWEVVGFLGALLATQVSYMVWLGLQPGDLADNAFGPPRPFLGKRH